MSNIAQMRMQRECREIAMSPEVCRTLRPLAKPYLVQLQESGIFLEPSDNLTVLTGRISGPSGGPFEGGSFQLVGLSYAFKRLTRFSENPTAGRISVQAADGRPPRCRSALHELFRSTSSLRSGTRTSVRRLASSVSTFSRTSGKLLDMTDAKLSTAFAFSRKATLGQLL